MASDCRICDQVGGPMVECRVCGRCKAPRGRSVSLETAGGYCNSDCPGYMLEPKPGELWPGERYGDSLGHMDWHDAAAGRLGREPEASE